MAKVKLYYDTKGNSLSVWFDNPKKEVISEETGKEVILNKDINGNVIGFEKLNLFPNLKSIPSALPLEVSLN
ncbi:MAG: DUF2283 domain-containing protein [bacterium]